MPADYARPPYQPPVFKVKGAAKVARVKKALTSENQEDAAKEAAKKRDGRRCRWPHATAIEREVCRRSHKEAAHFKAKGMGGNKDGSRNVRKNLITFCVDVHNPLYPKSIHAGFKRVKPLTLELMDAPCAFEEKIGGKWTEVGRESHVGVLVKVQKEK